MSRSHRDTTPISIRFEPEIAARLKAEAEARDLSASWLANKAVARFLDELIPVEEFTLTRPRDLDEARAVVEPPLADDECPACGHFAINHDDGGCGYIACSCERPFGLSTSP